MKSVTTFKIIFQQIFDGVTKLITFGKPTPMKKEPIRLSLIQRKAIILIKIGRTNEVLNMTLRALHDRGILEWIDNKVCLTKFGEKL